MIESVNDLIIPVFYLVREHWERSSEAVEHGTVKWFCPMRGYGFIAGDDGSDAFVHHSNILMKGFRFLETGQKVRYQTEMEEKGIKAINVILE